MDNHNEFREFTLRLLLTKKFGIKKFKEILDKNNSIEQLKYIINKDKIINLANLGDLDILKNMINRKGLSYVCFWEKDYPENLKNIPDSPMVLFYLGNKLLFKNVKNFSIVGSRKMSFYGAKTVRKIVSQFQGLDFTIVSGLANGIDSAAHRAALDYKIPTIAVLASSADEATPMNNIYLYNRILENNGLVISETLPGTAIQDGYFPRRNRIIAGISKGTLVVEAGENSGALITANISQVYDREVFAIPGNLDSIYSVGCNALIKNNKAKLIQDVNDILIEFAIGFKNLEANRDLSNLNSVELSIYKALESEPKLPEDIANFLNIDFSVIISSCSIMEMKGLLSKNEKGQYYLN